MIRFGLAGFLFAVLCLLSTPRTATAMGQEYGLQCVRAEVIEIRAAREIDQETCEWIAERVERAFVFASEQESWQDEALLWAAPLEVRVVESIASGALGYAQGQNLFVVAYEYLDDPLSEGTLAHELSHIQDARQLRGATLPSFLLEGRALTNGHGYRMWLGQEQTSYDERMAESAAGFTAADAESILDKVRDAGWNMQAMGTLLVEYMRVRWNGGGVPDIHPRLSRMIEIMAGGIDVEAAFQREFGTPATALLEEFQRFLNETQEDPYERLRGMMWDRGF